MHRRTWLIAFAVAIAACQLVDPIDDLRHSDAAADAPDAQIGGDGAPSDDAGSDAGPPTADAACAAGGGPPAVRVNVDGKSFCIDTSEVTHREYRDFLSAVDAGAGPTQPSYCAWNKSYSEFPVLVDDRPMASVDWCDALAFCTWAGKHLCGAFGGGAIPYNAALGDPTQSEWAAACSYEADGGRQPYPYGSTFDPNACNGAELDAGAALVVQSLSTCVGGVPHVFDMTGNLSEWVDSCSASTGSGDCCAAVGGSFSDYGDSCGLGASASGSCTNRTRADAHTDVGFRCCSE